MKTILELNHKIWYRLIKVIYVMGFVVVFLIGNVLLYSDNDIPTIDLKNTSIECNVKDKKIFIPESIDLYLFTNNSAFKNKVFDYKAFFGGYNDASIRDILKACYKNTGGLSEETIDKTDILNLQKQAELLYSNGLVGVKEKTEEQLESLNAEFNIYLENTKFLYGNNRLEYLDFNYQLFDIKPKFTYIPYLKQLLILNICIIIAFEIVRRSFYYIVLGKIKPNK